MKNRTLSLFLCMLVLSAVSCGEQAQTSADSDNIGSATETETAIITEEPKLSDSLSDADYNGEVFRIFGEYQVLNGDYFDVAEETGDVIEDNVYRRNRLVEDKYNITLEFQIVNQWEGKDLITTYITSGDDTIHLFTNTFLNLGSLLV